MKSVTDEQAVYEEICRWTEPSSVEDRARWEFSDSENERYRAVRNLDLPVAPLLRAIWDFISQKCEPGSDLAEGFTYFGYQTEGNHFYAAGWLLRGFVEGEDPQEWFKSSCNDHLFDMMNDQGLGADDVWESDFESTIQDLLTQDAFTDVRAELMRLAFEGPRNSLGKTCAEVILGARN